MNSGEWGSDRGVTTGLVAFGLEVAAWDSGMVTVLPAPCQNTQPSRHLLSMDISGVTLTPGDTLINQSQCL